jgi:hypothetical protein
MAQKQIGKDEISSVQAFLVLGNWNHVQEEIYKVSVVCSIRENFCIIMFLSFIFRKSYYKVWKNHIGHSNNYS